MTVKTKKWLISSLVTFLTGFFVVVTPMLEQLNIETLGWATVSGVLFAGLRGGIKYLTEYLIKLYDQYR